MGQPRSPFAYVTPPEISTGVGARRPIAIVGAGPVGLATAIDLACRGVRTVVIDDNDVVSTGSRAICWSKRTLEIFDRLGVGDRMVDKGVTWRTGRVFRGRRELYAFDLLPERGHKMPAFVNLQQYYVEGLLVDRARELGDLIELRWKNRLVGLSQEASGVALDIETPDGRYRLDAEWVVAADGANSQVRRLLGLAFEGERFEERFLIADVRMEAGFPNERLFWFEPDFHPGQSALLHRQPDDVFRLDFQLGPDADPDLERSPERVVPRIRAVVGETPFTLEWCSVYAFRCARLERFVHGRIVFAGDSAHVVSPFGARGGNGGIQDADNLAWKLALVVAGRAPRSLIDSYDEERGHGADENIRNSSRTTNFMTPKGAAERLFRNAVLDLAADVPFARSLTNAGRLSRPCSLAGSSLQTAGPEGRIAAGTPCPDAPLRDDAGRPVWLLGLLGRGFTLMIVGAEAAVLRRAAAFCRDEGLGLLAIDARPPDADGIAVHLDAEGFASARYGPAGTVCLIRPDQHVAAAFACLDEAAIQAALRRACGRDPAPMRDAA